MYAICLPIETPFVESFYSSEVLSKHLILDGKSSFSRKKLSRKELKTFLRCLPMGLREHCIGLSKSSINNLPVHVHTTDSCAVNFYVTTNKEETIFYEGKIVKIDIGEEDTDNGYFLVDPAKLSPVLSFVASSGEVWVLNTQLPHAVIGGLGGERQVIQLFFNVPIKKVVDEFLNVLSS